MIKLKDYKLDTIDAHDISEILNSKIPIEDCFSLSSSELCYKALKHFNFKKLESNPVSISKYCQIVLDQTKILRNSDDPITYFLAIFMGVGKHMLKIKSRLEQQARKHLIQVEDILDFYQTLPFIIKFQSEPSKPTSNDERMQLEFYKRAIAKKNEIIEYIIHGSLRKAKEKSVLTKSERPENLKEMYEQFDFHEDFPYTELLYPTRKMVYALSLEKIDFRLINPLRNKMEWIDQKYFDAKEYTQVINAGFTKKIKAIAFFDVLLLCLRGLPVIKEREQIFLEMEYLFKKKKWNALYALALPQVEGIFTEMLSMTDNKKPKNSLTDKANSIRKYYEYSHYTMDYYEFTLANLRNRFSHTGKVENPKEKCYHLLMDIQYLLDICIDLDTPITKLSKLIKEGCKEMKHIGKFAGFLNLIDEIDKAKKLSTVKTMAEDFMYNQVLKHIDLKTMLKKLEKDFVRFAKEFDTSIYTLMYKHNPAPFDILSMQIKDIKPLTSLMEKEMNHIPIMVSDRYKLLVNTSEFLTKFPKFFPDAPKAIHKAIDKLKASQEDKLKKIHFLTQHISFEIDDSFILYKDKMEHYIK